MAAQEPKQPRNPDQDVPRREGDNFPSPATPGTPERERDRPLPEEESYEREPTDQREPQRD